jgi:hypothetical protein
MGGQLPGPICQVSAPQFTDAGTMCLAASPTPGTLSAGSNGINDTAALNDALAALQSQAEIFAWRYINDAKARQAYVSRIARASQELLQDVRASRLSAAEAARIANQARNVIMQETRAITSAVGRAGAQSIKATGVTLDEAIDKAVKKLFPGKSFAELAAAQKQSVFIEVVEASGRSSPKFTQQVPKWSRFGKGLAVVTVAISAYNIWQAENKLRQGVKEGATLLGGALGGAAANASAGFLCGPGAPVCVTALFVIGGIAGALIASNAADYVLDQKEIVAWLGE